MKPRGRSLMRGDRSLAVGIFLAVALFVAGCIAPAGSHVADRGFEIHYSPAETLERIDVALIDRADHSVDLAAYVLTDWPVIEALSRATNRGANVRIYLDPSQLANDEAQRPVPAAFLDGGR